MQVSEDAQTVKGSALTEAAADFCSSDNVRVISNGRWVEPDDDVSIALICRITNFLVWNE